MGRKKGRKRARKEEDDDSDNADARSGEAEEFVVEKVIGKRTVAGGLQYKIKWKGYNNPEDDTWEPYANIKDSCKEAIEEFEGKNADSDHGDRPVDMDSESDAESKPKKGRGRPSKATVEESEEEKSPKRKRKTSVAADSGDESVVSHGKPSKGKKGKEGIPSLKETDALLADGDVVVESIVKIGKNSEHDYLIALVKLDCKTNPVAVSWNVLKKHHPQVIIEHCQRMIKFKD